VNRRSRRELTALAQANSLAEFRRDAHTLRQRHLTGVVALDSYLTFGGLGLGLALVLFGLFGMSTAPVASTARSDSVWLLVAGVILTVLIAIRLVRLFRNARLVREAVDALSADMERRADHGDLPEQPADWNGPMPPPVATAHGPISA